MAAEFSVGIDLGTTNCVLAYTRLTSDDADIKLLAVPQLVSPATTEEHSTLPSFLYLGTAHDAKEAGLDLPWGKKRRFAVGRFARSQSAEMPDRTVVAAKSWLCHSRVDRREPILPWNAPGDIEKVSPLLATQRYLEHLIAAWTEAMPDAPILEQQVMLTVPASFDAVARELTREAAIAAGLPEDLILLEEPQAALYAWLATAGDAWRKKLKLGDKILVNDVGGGTTDLTLIGIDQEDGELVLRRIAVGRHLLVGGDNMDLALAHMVAGKFDKQGTKLDPWQSVSLWHSCRAAKETLLADDGPKKHSISVLGRGSKLIGGTVSVELDRKRVADLLVEGFLPRCAASDRPQQQRASGFQQIGLPFESDTGITRHIAQFLGDHAEGKQDMVQPTHVLFNGGVFKSQILRQRLLDALGDWSAGVLPLQGSHDLDYAVARGAAYYGWTKQHGGVRIRGGAARSYYVGIETSGLAIPGAERPLQALCVVPIGMEEGTETDVPSAEIGLVLGEPAHFRFFSSSVRKEDAPGDVLSQWSADQLQETDSLETTLPADDADEDSYVAVQFQSRITELGMFELWCVNNKTHRRWKLEFSVRDEDAAAQ